MEAFRARQPVNRPRDARSATEVRGAKQVVLPGDQSSQTRSQTGEATGKSNSRLKAEPFYED